ncbi:MAG: PH domain-containing protein [Candidatus Kerfeldbacteria bacterium]|nr:PH domain-containing protein [Candidatus Kerfeldbacteria bacterium]
MTIDLQPNEQILMKAMANHMLHGITSIGYLWLTNQRVFFCTRPINFKHETFSFPLHEIRDVTTPNILKIFPQGLHITSNSGLEATFSVWNRKKWITSINGLRFLK